MDKLKFNLYLGFKQYYLLQIKSEKELRLSNMYRN